MLLTGIGFAGVGGWYLLVSERGTPTRATVTSCKTIVSGPHVETRCSGYWIVGGPLRDGGHKVYGRVDGAGSDDVNSTIAVRVYHGRAYVRASTLAYALLGFGGFFVLLGVGLGFFFRWFYSRPGWRDEKPPVSGASPSIDA